MSDFRYLPSLKSQDSLRETQQIDNEKYRSIFTYNTDLGPSTFSSSNSQKSKDQKKSHETTITNMKNNSNMAYSKLKQKEDEEMGSHRSAFDYKSIFTYSNPGDSRAKHQAFDYSEPSSNAVALQTELEGLSGKIVSNLALIFSYILVFFTLPISIWFCFKNLPQWERIVIYRMGKLQGVKGPGNIFLIPWLDSCSKLDLRTQLICHPLKQFLTKDQAIVEASCSIYYRISDPIMYTSNISDPGLKGLKILANAITLKRFETATEKEFHPTRKSAIEARILSELNAITTPWGIEISSVQIEDARILKESQPVSAFMDMMQQMGISFGSGDSAPAPDITSVSLADIGIHWEGVASGLISKNASRLEKVLKSTNGTFDDSAVICFKVGNEEPFYADFAHGKGQVFEECPGEVTITISLPQSLFDSMLSGASQSQFLQAYLEGQITIDGDTQALMQLQKLLPNLQGK